MGGTHGAGVSVGVDVLDGVWVVGAFVVDGGT